MAGKRAAKRATSTPAAPEAAAPGSYVVFARKYRPATFDAVVGQEVVARTLADAVRADRVAHAYLLAGPRGVGKTSIARILAKSLNCEGGPTAEPCGTCASCRAITEGGDVDVAEIDGASNRGIEEVRAIRDNARYLPARSRYRIYLIDEVHMLTREAFNALLKTLEEPPPHVKFLFATTAPERVPETVRSRCQRFDFRRIADDVIAAHLADICTREERTAEPAALAAIARKADGGLRDALSLLDQAFAGGARTLTAAGLPDVLGWTPLATLVQTATDLAAGDATASLRRVEQLYAEGRDPADFTGELLGLVRDCVVGAAAGPELARTPGLDAGTLDTLTGAAGTERWLATAQILSEARRRMDGGGGDARLHLELALLTACRLGEMRPLGEAVERLAQLAAGGPAPAPTAPARPGAPAARPAAVARPATTAPPAPKPVSAPAPIRKPPPSSERRARPAADAPAPCSGPGPDPGLADAWAAVLQAAEGQSELLAYLGLARPLRVEGGRLVLGLPLGHEFQRDQLVGDRWRPQVEALVATAYGQRWRVHGVCDPAVPAPTGPTVAPKPPASEAAAGRSDALRAVLEAFDGRVVPPEEIQ